MRIVAVPAFLLKFPNVEDQKYCQAKIAAKDAVNTNGEIHHFTLSPFTISFVTVLR